MKFVFVSNLEQILKLHRRLSGCVMPWYGHHDNECASMIRVCNFFISNDITLTYPWKGCKLALAYRVKWLKGKTFFKNDTYFYELTAIVLHYWK